MKIFFKIPFTKSLIRYFFSFNHKDLETEVCGIKFKNPVGLAAGFDKDAKLIDELACFGFGFIEIGTLTPEPQQGNPKPRLFRLKNDHALINRMGFNNAGVYQAVKRLSRRKPGIVVGGNIGKNKDTPNQSAVEDYERCYEALFDVVDYFVVNVSSPNTPDLRELQDKEPLMRLLSRIKEVSNSKSGYKPIFLKIAPDLNNTQLDDIVEIAIKTKIDGIVATNTTISRHLLQTSGSQLDNIGEGGLSGSPIKNTSTDIIKYLNEKLAGEVPIIGVGGIFTGNDALEKLDSGASLVQVYTGFIYEGPSLVKNINKKILKKKQQLK